MNDESNRQIVDPPVATWTSVGSGFTTHAVGKIARAAAMGAASLLWVACAARAEPATVIAADQEFSLQAGQFAQTPDGALRVGFDAVLADSRCPKGEQCLVAGDATLRIWVQQAAGARQVRELHAVPGPTQAVQVADRRVQLMRLNPSPVTGRTPSLSAYVATMKVSEWPPAEADR